MRLHNTDIVVPDDERPARRDGTCFYCGQRIGAPHKVDCVIVSRSVVLKVEFEVVTDFPRDWDVGLIEFSRNESSWCATNFLDELERWRELTGGCLCGSLTTTFVREATRQDHDDLPVLVKPRKLDADPA